MNRSHGVRRLADGGVRVRLSVRERDALASLPRQILPIMSGESEMGAAGTAMHERLFPSAYRDDVLADIEYHELIGSAVADLRAEALRTFAQTLGTGVTRRLVWTVDLSADEAAAWLSAVNDARLTLAMFAGIESETQWDAGPDPTDPRSVMLFYLGWLEEELVTALMGELKTCD